MKSKSLILMFVSLGFGLIAAIGISQVMGGSRNKGDAIRTGPVIVAQDFIDINSDLSELIVKVEEWPLNIIPENSARSLDEIENKVAIRGIPKGAPVFMTDIIDKNKAGSLAIKKGQRLYSIEVGRDGVANGLMRPGDRVDVIGVFEKLNGATKTTFTVTFLKNIQVYSVNDSITSDGPRTGGSAKTNSIVGLLLSQKQIEQTALAQKVGILRLSLRPNSTDEEEEGEPLPSFLTGGELPTSTAGGSKSGSMSDMVKSMMTSPIMQDKPFEMVLWSGSEKTKYTFRQDGSTIDPVPELDSKQDRGDYGLDRSDSAPNAGGDAPELDSPPLGGF